MNIECTATNGVRCSRERHTFRIGVAADQSTQFTAMQSEFHAALVDALIDHGVNRRPSGPNGLYLQVVCGESNMRWSNCQNPKTGGVIAVQLSIVDHPETSAELFLWCCNSVQMGRDLAILADGLARASIEP